MARVSVPPVHLPKHEPHIAVAQIEPRLDPTKLNLIWMGPPPTAPHQPAFSEWLRPVTDPHYRFLHLGPVDVSRQGLFFNPPFPDMNLNVRMSFGQLLRWPPRIKLGRPFWQLSGHF